jgi:two-component system, NarL family, invasion response regulator UvrY
MNPRIKISVVDDHKIFRQGLQSVISADKNLMILFEASDGIEFIEKLDAYKMQPDILLLDIRMPRMDGIQTLDWLKTFRPAIKVLIISMYDDPTFISLAIKKGAHGYILKSSEPEEIRTAIYSIIDTGFHYTSLLAEKLTASLLDGNWFPKRNLSADLESIFTSLSEREKLFIAYACTDLTYSAIADAMKISPKTVDGYRDKICTLFNVSNRIGIAMFAIKNNLVDIESLPPNRLDLH